MYVGWDDGELVGIVVGPVLGREDGAAEVGFDVGYSG